MSVTREHWRRLFLVVCAAVFCHFCHACHPCSVFNNFDRSDHFLAVRARPEEIVEQLNRLRMSILFLEFLMNAQPLVTRNSLFDYDCNIEHKPVHMLYTVKTNIVSFFRRKILKRCTED